MHDDINEELQINLQKLKRRIKFAKDKQLKNNKRKGT